MLIGKERSLRQFRKPQFKLLPLELNGLFSCYLPIHGKQMLHKSWTSHPSQCISKPLLVHPVVHLNEEQRWNSCFWVLLFYCHEHADYISSRDYILLVDAAVQLFTLFFYLCEKGKINFAAFVQILNQLNKSLNHDELILPIEIHLHDRYYTILINPSFLKWPSCRSSYSHSSISSTFYFMKVNVSALLGLPVFHS